MKCLRSALALSGGKRRKERQNKTGHELIIVEAKQQKHRGSFHCPLCHYLCFRFYIMEIRCNVNIMYVCVFSLPITNQAT